MIEEAVLSERSVAVPSEGAEGAPAERHAAKASVTLDIGAGRGALVIYPGERFRGREIEISPAGDGRRVHTGVHERRVQSGLVLTAIFGSLPAGAYEIWSDASTCAARVEIHDSAVTELSLG